LLPDAISATVAAANAAGIPAQRIFIEITESEIMEDRSGMVDKLHEFRRHGMNVVIDDFGAGYSGLNLLADYPPDIVKLDMQLVRNIDSHGPRQAVVRAILQCCGDLGIDVIAEGVESEAEYRWFRRRQVRLFQGFFIAKPAFEALTLPPFPPA
jgi:EAL domain-containing protein (putative c-di-GMP-specific phosphodiesterase class I)